jgi:hypothetical protein
MPEPSLPPALGALFLSEVRAGSVPLLRRALGWARDLERLGVTIALPIVHDLGLLLAVPSAQLELGARRTVAATLAQQSGAPALHAAYGDTIRRLAADETIDAIRALAPSDDLVVVLLTRLLSDASSPRTTASEHQALLAAPLDDLERRLPALFAQAPRAGLLAALARFVDGHDRLRVLLDTIDLDTIRLLALVGGAGESSAMSAAAPFAGLAQVELLAALGSLQANDVVNFSLELLPAVLETKRRAAPGTWAVGGFQGLARRGSIDSMVLTELAWDDAELARRMLDDEVYYHARERAEDEASRVHLVLVDASASMRGDRTTFARGVAIALAKRLELEGEEVRIRFFDGRLYEPFGGVSSERGLGRSARKHALAAAIPHILAFRGERGRSPERVLRQLVAELDVLRARDHRTPVVHLVTHAAFYASRATVAEVRARAALFAVFITPHFEGDASGAPGAGARRGENALDLDWLDVLDDYWTIDQATLARHDERATRAKELVTALPDAALSARVRPQTTAGNDRPPASVRHGAPTKPSVQPGPPSSRRGA